MHKGRVVQVFKGVPDGASAPRTFELGDHVVGDLARVALQEGWAEPVEPSPPDQAVKAAPAPKRARRKRRA